MCLRLTDVGQISYTYGDVITTLAMIETPTASVFEADSNGHVDEADAPLLSEDQKSEKMKSVQSDLFLVKQKPITAKMCTAVRHITAQGGRLARFRGLHVAVIYHAAHSLIVNLFTGGNKFSFLRPFVAVMATIVLCRLHMTWTHIVISAPSTKKWWRRFPAVNSTKNIIIPAAIFEVAVQTAIYVPGTLLLSVQQSVQGLDMQNSNTLTAQKIALVQMLLVIVIAISTYILIVVPAETSLKRVEASMLPEEDDTIVPFDRSFAGKVVPEILGGSGAVSMLDAWKTFDRSARFRLLKLIGKIVAVQFATTVMFVFVIVGELRLILGDDFTKMVNAIREATGQS